MIRAITVYVPQAMLDDLRRACAAANLEYCGDQEAAQLAVGTGLQEEIATYRGLAESFDDPAPPPTEPMVTPSDWTGALQKRQAAL